MISQTSYDLRTAERIIHLTITPTNAPLPGGDFYSTGTYKLAEGVVGMGEIVFDDNMENWEYNGIDELTWEQAARVAQFIKNYKDPVGADPNALNESE